MFLTDRALEQVQQQFEQNFVEFGELGASVSVWYQGDEVLNISKGWREREQFKEWDAETMVPVYSATKGPASATLLMVLERNGLKPTDLISAVWPEFPVKEATFAQLLSHQVGLPHLDQRVSVFDYEGVVDAIHAQEPVWGLGDGHGYHPRIFGFLLDECVRRIEQACLGAVFHELIARPLKIDMWIGLPEEQHHRVATLYPGKMSKADLLDGFYKDFNTHGTLVKKAFSSPKGLHSVVEMNKPEAWVAGLPAMGGVATATALAKFYQAAIGEVDLFSHQVQDWMGTTQIMGEDRILKTQTHFTCGFQKDPLDSFGRKIRHHYGVSDEAFGHPGAGGSHAFGDPATGISYAYIMNQMELSVLPGAKSVKMIDALFGVGSAW